MTAQYQAARTPHGRMVRLGIRPDTSDGSHAVGMLVGDEYRFADIPPDTLVGTGLDIGSYAGHASIALAGDHPHLRMIAVDPVQENIELLTDTLVHNGMEYRVIPRQAAACDVPDSTRTLRYDYSGAIDHGNGHTTDASYVHGNRFMAGLWRQQDVPGRDVTVPTVTIRSLAAEFHVERFAICKIDCEGCEYEFLADGADLIDLIVGEYHDGGPDRITDLLLPTHDVEILEDHGGTGIFRARRRSAVSAS